MSTQMIDGMVSELVAATRPGKHGQPRKPSARNFEIYDHVYVKRIPQLDTAAEFGLTQQRVSAICRQVGRWIREHEETDAAGDERNERFLAKRRLEEVYRWSLWGLKLSNTQQDTTIVRIRGNETTSRDYIQKSQPHNERWAKLALAAAKELNAISAKQEEEQPRMTVQPSAPSENRRVEQAEKLLRLVGGLRRMVRKEGVQKCLPQVVEQIMQSCLVGQEQRERLAGEHESAVVRCATHSHPGAKHSHPGAKHSHPEESTAGQASSGTLTPALSQGEREEAMAERLPVEVPCEEAAANCGNYCADNSAEMAARSEDAAAGSVVNGAAAASCDEQTIESEQPVATNEGEIKWAGTIASPPKKRQKFKAPAPPFSPAEAAALAKLERLYGIWMSSDFATEKVNELEMRDVLRIDLGSYAAGQVKAIAEWKRLLVEREAKAGDWK